MQHSISVDSLGPQGEAMARAIETCVHCGFCLAACPTYRVLGEEMDSPRGRIVLMKSALEGELPVEATLPFVDRCLGCMACVPACPSGVAYNDLLPAYRAHAEARRGRGPVEAAARLLTHETLPYPGRFRLAAAAGRLARPARGLLPEPFAAMLALLPEELPRAEPLPEIVPAQGPRRARVALLAGCVQQAIQPEVNRATARVLARNGVEVVIPREQGCCGALALHAGEARRARDLARRNLRAFPAGVDAVLTNAAGCGSGMKEYGLVFKGMPEAAEAEALAGRVQDVSEFLAGLGLLAPPPLARPLRLAYHDACHLAHAQRVTEAPRRLLQSIPNLTLLEVPEGDMCCGSAGTYNLEQPALAAALGERKAGNIASLEPEAVAAGNIGCLVQIGAHLRRLGRPVPVWHTLEVLDRAYRSVTEEDNHR
jgi:glycolate oxidase iron-sulfur subunit